MRQEFEAAGVPLSRQGAGFIEALRAVWGPDPVSFDGRFYKIAASKVNPKPVQAGGPPIIVGANTPASIRRTARLGLGLNPIWFGWEALEGTLGTFRAAAEEAGRDPAGLPVVLRVNAALTGTPSAGEASVVGSPEQVVEALPRLERLGVSEISWPADPTGEQLTLVGRVVELTGQNA